MALVQYSILPFYFILCFDCPGICSRPKVYVKLYDTVVTKCALELHYAGNYVIASHQFLIAHNYSLRNTRCSVLWNNSETILNERPVTKPVIHLARKMPFKISFCVTTYSNYQPSKSCYRSNCVFFIIPEKSQQPAFE
jgi:hypothetical protein